MRRTLTIIFLLILIATGLYLYHYRWENRVPDDVIVLFGNVDVRQVDLGFRVSGRVNSMLFDEGALIPPNTFIADLDKQPYADQVLQAQASIESTNVNLGYAEKVLKRRQALLDVGDGSISREDYENAFASHAALAANLQEAHATLGIAKSNFSYTELYSPAEGIILTRIREPGSVVREGDPIYTLSLTSPVWIRAFIPERLLGVVYPNMAAEVYTDTKGGPIYKGHVGFISPVAEFTPKTVETTQLRTDLVYRLRIIADNPDKGLRQGMPVTVRLLLKPQDDRNISSHK